MRPLLLLAAVTALVSASCYSPGDGQPPPLDKLYFPTGLALDEPFRFDGTLATMEADIRAGKPSSEPRPSAGYLYVASSDFDLQYRSSSLLSYDLGLLRQAVPRSCTELKDCEPDEVCDSKATAANGQVPSYFCVNADDQLPCPVVGERGNADRLLYPGRCNSLDPARLIRSTVGIGAFATDVIFAASPESSPTPSPSPSLSRLFLPVRGDATLHWIDLNDGQLLCDQDSTDDDSCGHSHRAGDDPTANNNNIQQPAEPFGIAATQDGRYLAITNQTGGSVSLFTHAWGTPDGPELVTILGGLPQAPVAIAAVPDPFLTPDPDKPNPDRSNPSPGFLVAYRNAAQLDLLRVRDDDTDNGTSSDYPRYALTYAGSSAIGANSLGYDSRDIVIDDTARLHDCGAKTDPANVADPDAYVACVAAADRPDVYVANRAPASLLVGALTADFSYASGSNDLPSFNDSVALTSGPSRLVRGQVKVTGHTYHDENGTTYDLESRVFIVCFDSRRIFVYDPKRHVIESIIATGRGPYALAVDEGRGLAYVAHFTDSYLGVVSLDQRYPQTYATIVASIGNPLPPRSSK
ncbi:MAG: hypothetical protein ABW061_24175 [Polyangiaceae bacterium]